MPLTVKVKGDVLYPGGALLVVAVPEALKESVEPEIDTDPSSKGQFVSVVAKFPSTVICPLGSLVKIQFPVPSPSNIQLQASMVVEVASFTVMVTSSESHPPYSSTTVNVTSKVAGLEKDGVQVKVLVSGLKEAPFGKLEAE